MRPADRWMFCALAGMVLLTAVSALIAGGERPDPVSSRPSVAIQTRLLA